MQWLWREFHSGGPFASFRSCWQQDSHYGIACCLLRAGASGRFSYCVGRSLRSECVGMAERGGQINREVGLIASDGQCTGAGVNMSHLHEVGVGMQGISRGDARTQRQAGQDLFGDGDLVGFLYFRAPGAAVPDCHGYRRPANEQPSRRWLLRARLCRPGPQLPHPRRGQWHGPRQPVPARYDRHSSGAGGDDRASRWACRSRVAQRADAARAAGRDTIVTPLPGSCSYTARPPPDR
jgi:hypothetical protein